LLTLTGCRKSEIVRLRWDEVDRVARELKLSNAKTGPRVVPRPSAVAAVLDRIPRDGNNPWVIQGRKKGERLCFIDRQWCLVRKRAKLGDVRIHDCRHPSPRALVLGKSLPAIGRLLGHTPFRDHGALCPSGAGFHAPGSGAGRRQHRS